MKEVKLTPVDRLALRRYDPTKHLEPEQILFRIDRENIGALQNIVTVSGLPKQGKGRYMGAFAASALSNTEIFSSKLRTADGRNKIAYFDTEQGEYDFQKQMDFIKHMAGITNFPPNFDAFNTREDFPKEQIEMIDAYLQQTPDCSVLFLDGLLDLMDSFNDEKESKALMQLQKKWTKVNNLLIIQVLHRRKDGGTTLGHIGSAADRVSQSVLTVEKNKERKTFILKPEFLRSADEFTPVEIMYNRSTQEWQQTWYTPDEDDKKLLRMKKPKPGELDIEVHRTALRRIFDSQPVRKYKDLLDEVCQMYAAGVNWSKECIPYLISQGLLFKTADGYTIDKQARLYIQK